MARRTASTGAIGTTSPTMRTQFARRAAPVAHQSSMAGLEGASQALSNFFGNLQQTVGSVSELAHKSRMEDIRFQNEAEKEQAGADFMAGKTPDQNLLNDSDYMDTYRHLKAGRIASDAALDFNQWYQTEWVGQNRHGDLSAARQEWANSNLMGIEDTKMQTMVLGTFFDRTESSLLAHQENSIRWKIEEDKQELGVLINDHVASGQMNADTLLQISNMAKQIDPMNPQAASPFVAKALLTAVRNDPSKADQVIKLLDSQGTGINGRSFAETFPDVFEQVQTGALEATTRTTSLAQQKLYRDIEVEMMSNPNPTSADIQNWMSTVMTTKALMGGSAEAERLENTLFGMVNQQAKNRAGISQVHAMIAAGDILDPSAFKEGLPAYMETLFGSRSIRDVVMSDDPTKAVQMADIITKSQGQLPAGMVNQIGSDLQNGANPEAQAAMMKMLMAVEGGTNATYIENLLGGDAAKFYAHARSKIKYDGDVVAGLAATLEAREKNHRPEDRTYASILGEEISETEASVKVTEQITKKFGELIPQTNFMTKWWSDVPPKITHGVTTAIQEEARRIFVERETDGVTWDAALTEATQRVVRSANVAGSVNDPIFELGGSTVGVDLEDGAIPPLSPLATSTRTQKSTLDVFRSEMADAGEKAAALFAGVDGEDLTVSRIETGDNHGAYNLRANGRDLIYEGGEAFVMTDGTSVTLPTVPAWATPQQRADALKQAAETLEPYLGDGFGMTLTPVGMGHAFQLLYRPHYGELEADSLDAREAAYSLYGMITEEEAVGIEMNGLHSMLSSNGLLPASSGATMALPKASSPEEYVRLLEEEMNRGINQSGRRMIDRNTVSRDQTYASRRRSYLTDHEAIRRTAYDDRTGRSVTGAEEIRGSVTVGIGFNMDRSGARETWRKVFGNEVAFDDVYSGKAQLSAAQVETLFDYDMQYFEGVVDKARGGTPLPENQHMALLSVAYNSPARVRNMSSALREGDKSEVLRLILYESFNPQHPQRNALAQRRYKEALNFAGLDPELRAALPAPAEYLKYWR